MSDTGGENATPGTVRQYLAENYGYIDGGQLSEQDLDTLLAKYDDIVQNGVRAGSFANYVGDKIAQAAELVDIGTDPDEDES
jgi:ABC-type enterochelin transport system substrate-binding protein